MNIVTSPARKISGVQTRTTNTLESNPVTGRIPGLWQDFYDNYFGKTLPQGAVFGVYSEYETDGNGPYTLTAGVENEQELELKNVHSLVVPKGNYLVFEGRGPMPVCVIKAWTDVWNYFESEEATHQRAFSYDFEEYLSAEAVNVHIAIV